MEVAKLLQIVQTYGDDRRKGDVDDVTNNYLDYQQQLTLMSCQTALLSAEAETIGAALDGDIGGQQPHSFKSASFSIPTTCGYCNTAIWGLTKQGKTCKACGLSVHSKCELKVPADCGNPRPSAKNGAASASSSSSNLNRTDSRVSTISTASSARQSYQAVKEEAASHPTARVVYDFIPTSEFELAVSDGSIVQIVEEDDGSGWVKVLDKRGQKGLVPSTYLEVTDDEGAEAAARETKPGGSGVYVRALYPYQASEPGEIDLAEGEIIELSGGPGGGKNYGDGWWEGYNKANNKGVFPSNYVEET